MDLGAAKEIRLYWMPGCTSCVAAKEFLSSHGVAFEAVNVLAEPNAVEELRSLGVRSVPVVTRGNEFVFAQSLDDVAAFLHIKVNVTRLSASNLMDRWFYFLEMAQSLIGDIPPSRLDMRPVTGRDRTVRALAFHIFQVPEAFLENVQNGLLDLNIVFDAPVPCDIRTTVDIIRHGTAVTGRLKDWWSSVEDQTVPWTVDTFYGRQPLHSFIERSTWHTAQHVRQLSVVLESVGAVVTRPVAKSAYEGLPMPEAVWA